MGKIIKYIEKAESAVMIVGIVFSCLILFVQVILRYVFNSSLPWIEEAARYIFVYFTWIGTSIAASRGSSSQHIRVELILTRFPKAAKYLELFTSIVCLGVSLVMFVYGINLLNIMRMNVAVSPTLKIPMWIAYMVIPISGLLISIKYLYRMIQDIQTILGKEVSQ